MAEPVSEETLDALRERVRDAHDAAERLVREASARAEGAAGGAAPPRGWASPGASDGPALSGEIQALVALLESVRALLPDELREQVAELVRQLLLVLRSLIDWLVTRLDDAPRGAERPVEDIPIS